MAKEKKSKKRLLKAGLIILGLTVVGALISGSIGVITIAKDIITVGAVAETGIVCGGVTNAIMTAIKNKKSAKNQENSLSRNRSRTQEQVYSLEENPEIVQSRLNNTNYSLSSKKSETQSKSNNKR